MFNRIYIYLAALPAFMCANIPARAADIALLAGYQFDSDVEISTSDQWPPASLPTGNPGDVIEMDDGSSWAVALNVPYQNHINQRIGLYYSQHGSAFADTAGLGNPGLDISFLHFTGTNIYPQSENFSFFVAGGVGAAFYKPDDSSLRDVTRLSVQLGFGGNYRFTDNFFLQLDGRWLPTFFNSETAIFCSGGCTISVNADSISQFQWNAGLMLRF